MARLKINITFHVKSIFPYRKQFKWEKLQQVSFLNNKIQPLSRFYQTSMLKYIKPLMGTTHCRFRREFIPPTYRFYIDNEIMSERDFIWESEIYIQEQVSINLTTGQSHKITIENLTPDLGNFSINTLEIDDKTIEMVDGAFKYD